MSEITKAERKKVFFGTLSQYLDPLGYEHHLKGDDPSYSLKKNNVVVSFGYNFLSNDEIACGPLNITHYSVEDHLLEIGIPTNALVLQKKKGKYHLATVHYRMLPESMKRTPLRTKDEVEAYARLYIAFLEKEGSAFIEKYSYLPNVLLEMDRLKLEVQDWNVILSGMGDRLIRGLIIAKLCNDPKYSNKFEYCDKKFTTVELLKEWLPYWEKYKQLLEKIETKYNL